MNLALAVPVRGGQVLGDVAFATSTVAAGVAANTRTRSEAPANQRAAFLEQTFDLLAMLLRGLEQTLSQPAGAFAHGVSVLLSGTLCKHLSVPAFVRSSSLGMDGGRTPRDAQLLQRVTGRG